MKNESDQKDCKPVKTQKKLTDYFKRAPAPVTTNPVPATLLAKLIAPSKPQLTFHPGQFIQSSQHLPVLNIDQRGSTVNMQPSGRPIINKQQTSQKMKALPFVNVPIPTKATIQKIPVFSLSPLPPSAAPLLDLTQLHKFFLAFSKPLFDTEFTLDLAKFSSLFFDASRSVDLMRVFFSVCTYCDLFQIVPDVKVKSIDTLVFLQRELECIFHSNKQLEENESISNAYEKSEWSLVSPLVHLRALKALVFSYLVDTEEYLSFISDIINTSNGEKKSRWNRNVKRKEALATVESSNKEILALDQKLLDIKANFANSDSYGGSPRFAKKNATEMQAQKNKQLAEAADLRDEFIAIYDLNQKSVSGMEVDDENGDALILMSEQCIRCAQIYLGTDRESSIYWFIDLGILESSSHRSYSILVESTNSITYLKIHSDLIALFKSLSDSEHSEHMLKKSICERVKHIDPQLTLSFNRVSMPAVNQHTILNEQRLSSFDNWLHTFTSQDCTESESYHSLFLSAIPILLEKVLTHSRSILDKKNATFSIEVDSSLLLDKISLGVKASVGFIDDLLWRIEQELDGVEFKLLFAEYDQMGSVGTMSDLCEWIFSLASVIAKVDKDMKALARPVEVLMQIDAAVFADELPRRCKTRAREEIASPVKRAKPTRYQKVKKRVIVMTSEEESKNGEADYEVQEYAERRSTRRGSKRN